MVTEKSDFLAFYFQTRCQKGLPWKPKQGSCKLPLGLRFCPPEPSRVNVSFSERLDVFEVSPQGVSRVTLIPLPMLLMASFLGLTLSGSPDFGFSYFPGSLCGCHLASQSSRGQCSASTGEPAALRAVFAGVWNPSCFIMASPFRGFAVGLLASHLLFFCFSHNLVSP